MLDSTTEHLSYNHHIWFNICFQCIHELDGFLKEIQAILAYFSLFHVSFDYCTPCF